MFTPALSKLDISFRKVSADFKIGNAIAQPVPSPRRKSKFKIGFAPWDEFYPDNADEKLYYLEANYVLCTVNYQHKNNPNYDNKAILRTSFETTKRIKQIRNLFNLSSWAKYFDYYDIDDLRKTIIEQLMYTNKTLDEIKREL